MNVYPEKMLKNINKTNGLIFSQRVMLELTNHGFSREKAYRIVQNHAEKSWKNGTPFFNCLANDNMIKEKISINKLKKIFDINYHTKKINFIFNRIFN